MERTIHQVEFASPAFVVPLEVASWVAEALAEAGVPVGVPTEDDDLAMVAVHGPGRVVVGCVAFGEDDACTATVEDVPKLLRRADPAADELVRTTVAALDAALRADPEVRDVRWSQGGPA